MATGLDYQCSWKSKLEFRDDFFFLFFSFFRISKYLNLLSAQVITIDELQTLMSAFRADLQDTDLTEMLNKANPVVDGNLSLTKHDFLALMAQAEFSAMFLETFKLLDPHQLGFLEAEHLAKVLDTLLAIENGPTFQLNYHFLADSFGLDEDGHIDYAAFVKILLSSSGSSLVPPRSKNTQSEPSS